MTTNPSPATPKENPIFNLILRPIVTAIRAYMDDAAYNAAREGAVNGLKRLAAEFGDPGVEALPETRPQAVPLTMQSAAQVTAPPASDDDKVAKARELIAGGMSQRDAAVAVDIPRSTLQDRLAKAN